MISTGRVALKKMVISEIPILIYHNYAGEERLALSGFLRRTWTSFSSIFLFFSPPSKHWIKQWLGHYLATFYNDETKELLNSPFCRVKRSENKYLVEACARRRAAFVTTPIRGKKKSSFHKIQSETLPQEGGVVVEAYEKPLRAISPIPFS